MLNFLYPDAQVFVTCRCHAQFFGKATGVASKFYFHSYSYCQNSEQILVIFVLLVLVVILLAEYLYCTENFTKTKFS